MSVFEAANIGEYALAADEINRSVVKLSIEEGLSVKDSQTVVLLQSRDAVDISDEAIRKMMSPEVI